MSKTAPVVRQTNREGKVLEMESDSPKSSIKLLFYRQKYKTNTETEEENGEITETIMESNEKNSHQQIESAEQENKISDEDKEQRRRELETEATTLVERLAMLRDEKHQLFNALRAILPERD
jgi:hypothetical protein